MIEEDGKTNDDIWRYSLAGDGRLEHLSVNSDAEEFSPVVTASGTLYFASNRDRTRDGWTAAVPIETLSSRFSDLMPRLHPNGHTLYFTTAPIGGHAQIITTNWETECSLTR